MFPREKYELNKPKLKCKKNGKETSWISLGQLAQNIEQRMPFQSNI